MNLWKEPNAWIEKRPWSTFCPDFLDERGEGLYKSRPVPAALAVVAQCANIVFYSVSKPFLWIAGSVTSPLNCCNWQYIYFIHFQGRQNLKICTSPLCPKIKRKSTSTHRKVCLLFILEVKMCILLSMCVCRVSGAWSRVRIMGHKACK